MYFYLLMNKDFIIIIIYYLHLYKGAFRETKTEVARSWPALNSSTKTDVEKHPNETMC